jgi:hypothetical protein
MAVPKPRKKTLVGAAGLAAALGVGGVFGAAFGSPSVSGALQSEDSTTTTAPTAEEAPQRPFGDHLAVAAELLGMTADELATALRHGSTVATIAAERGVDLQTIIDALVADSEDEHVERVTAFVDGALGDHGPGGPGGRGRGPGFRIEGLEAAGVDVQTVIDAMVADVIAEIDEAEAAGRIDAERAAELRESLPDHITALVNGELRGHGPGGGGGAPPDAPTSDSGD